MTFFAWNHGVGACAWRECPFRVISALGSPHRCRWRAGRHDFGARGGCASKPERFRLRSSSAWRHDRARSAAIRLGPRLLSVTTLDQALRTVPALGSGDHALRRYRAAPGDSRGTEMSARRARHPRCAAKRRHPERGELIPRVLRSQRAPICRHFSCRRRDSNPRHADYDSAALWLYTAVCGRWGTGKGTDSRGAFRGLGGIGETPTPL